MSAINFGTAPKYGIYHSAHVATVSVGVGLGFARGWCLGCVGLAFFALFMVGERCFFVAPYIPFYRRDDAMMNFSLEQLPCMSLSSPLMVEMLHKRKFL